MRPISAQEDNQMTAELESARLHLALRQSPSGALLTMTDKETSASPVRGSLLRLYPGGPVNLWSINVQQGHAARNGLVMAGEAPHPDEVRLSAFQDEGISGLKIITVYESLRIAQYLWLDDGATAIRARATLTNVGTQNVTVHSILTRVDGLRLGERWDDEWIFPATYANNVYTHGRVGNLRDEGIAFAFTPIGLYMPYMILYDPHNAQGLLYSSWLDTRFALLLNPDVEHQQASVATLTSVERTLFPGETHFWGEWSLHWFRGHYYQAMAEYRDRLGAERGLQVPADTPDFVPDLIMAGVHFDFTEEWKTWPGFTSPELQQHLLELQQIGINGLYVANQWRSALHHTQSAEPELRSPCVILPEHGRYTPEPAYGGLEGHQAFLETVHKLGMRAIAWITTSGLGFEAEEVQEHPEWFLHDEKGEIQATFRSERVKHIADANFLSPGWRRWFLENVKHLLALGYDGIFLDGIVPKGPDAWTYPWPGRGQNGAIDQVRELRREIKALAPDFLFVTEDCSCYWNALAEIGVDRYHLRLPSRPPQRDDPEAVRRTPINDGAYPKISPAEVLDYLRIGQLSLLPGAKVWGTDLKYHGRKAFPWLYYGTLADLIPLTPYRDKVLYSEEHIYRLPPEERQNEEWEERFYRELRAALALRRERAELRRAPVLFDALDVGPAGVVGFARPYAGRLSLVFINFWPNEQIAQVKVTQPEALGLAAGATYRIKDLLYPEISRLADEVWTAERLARPWTFQMEGYGASVFAVEPT
jgi:hypothetical protein